MAQANRSISTASLTALRESLEALGDARSGMPHEDLVRLAGVDVGADLTVDFTARESLGYPVVIMRPNGDSTLINRLSPREIEIVDLIASGLANKQIAIELGIQLGTVKDHVHRILEKTGCPNRAALATEYARHKPH